MPARDVRIQLPVPEFDYLLIDLKDYDLETIRDKLFKLDQNKVAYQLFKLAFDPEMLDNLIKEICLEDDRIYRHPWLCDPLASVRALTKGASSS